MAFSVKININKGAVKRITGDRRVGIFTAESFAKHANPFVPMYTGALSQNYKTEPYKVTYTAPYARKMFYGTGFNFSKESHQLATARWDKATKTAKGNVIAKEVEEFIRRM